jgi:hypothetical protein
MLGTTQHYVNVKAMVAKGGNFNLPHKMGVTGSTTF